MAEALMVLGVRNPVGRDLTVQSYGSRISVEMGLMWETYEDAIEHLRRIGIIEEPTLLIRTMVMLATCNMLMRQVTSEAMLDASREPGGEK